jgi:hypothetical protein
MLPVVVPPSQLHLAGDWVKCCSKDWGGGGLWVVADLHVCPGGLWVRVGAALRVGVGDVRVCAGAPCSTQVVGGSVAVQQFFTAHLSRK